MNTVLIAISAHRAPGDAGAGTVPDSYQRAVRASGASVLPLPIGLPEQAESALQGADALLLPGGGDLRAGIFGQAPDGSAPPDEARDLWELALVHAALRLQLPLLGICRGLQVLAVALGASLIQDLERAGYQSIVHQQGPMQPRDAVTHRVIVEAGAQAHILGSTPRLLVNSMHHQAVLAAPPGAQVAARADDGVIEALVVPELRFALGVQWHPEELVGRQDEHGAQARALFAALQAAAAERRLQEASKRA